MSSSTHDPVVNSGDTHGTVATGARNGLGIAGLVIGIVALCLFFLNWVAALIGVVGLVLSIIGLQRAKRGEATNRGMALAGVVLNAVAIVVGIAVFVGVAAMFMA